MRIGERARAEPPAAPPSTADWRSYVRPLVVVCVAGAVIGAFYFLVYPAKQYPMPIGWDTPRYLLQTNIVAAHGLKGVPSALPPPGKTLASRAAFPVIVLSLSSLFSASTFKLAQTVPVAAAVATALAAAAFVSVALRRRAWELAVVAFLVGVSPWLVRLMAPETYTDNLFFTALVLAALVPILYAVRDGRGFLAAILLLVAAALGHVAFFAAGMLVLAVVAMWLIPSSWRAWRDGASPLDTPAGRLAAILGISAGGAAVGLFGLLRRAPDTPRLSPGELSKKLREDAWLYAYPVTVPLAAAGAWVTAIVARRGGRRRPAAPDERAGAIARRFGFEEADGFGARFLLIVMAAWTLVVLLGLAAFFAGKTIPAHRFLALLLPIPILAAVGTLALGHRVSARPLGRVTRPAVTVVAAVMAGFAALSAWQLYVMLPSTRGIEWIEYHKIQDTANAAAYLDAEHVPADAPVVFVIDDWGQNPLSNVAEIAYIARSALPADRIEHSWFYVGNPENYLSHRPTHRARPATYDTNSDSFWQPLQEMLSRQPSPPVALLLKDLTPFWDRVQAKHPDWVVAPGVMALNGPRPAAPLPAAIPPWGMRTVPQGVVLSAGTLLVLALVGLGWALALGPSGLRAFEALALAPAFGIGFLVLSGVLVDAAGIRLAGSGGTLTVVLAAAAGWVAAAVRIRQAGFRTLFPAA